MEEMLKNGEVDAAVTMHFPFPIGHTPFLLYGEHVKKFCLSILQLSSFRCRENHFLVYLIQKPLAVGMLQHPYVAVEPLRHLLERQLTSGILRADTGQVPFYP